MISLVENQAKRAMIRFQTIVKFQKDVFCFVLFVLFTFSELKV